jgi:shikimate dehydrogenase
VSNKVGVIGWPIEHSLSPAMHNAAFAALGMSDWEYDKYAIPPDIVKLSLREFRDAGFIGLNVTVPHKQAVMPYVKPDEIAKAVGAVNTIDFRHNRGTNTDVAGVMDDLAAHGVNPSAGMQVVVLGAGGAARAAVYGLAQAEARITIVNRTPERARELIDSLRVRAVVGEVDAVAEAALIINCTSAGMQPKVDDSPLPDDAPLQPGVVVYDMVYRPAVTKLMRQAEAAGGRAIGGLGMLARQGAAAFKIWTGVEPPVDVMLAAAQRELDKRS